MVATQCPVCGAPVDPQTAPAEGHRDEEYFFCSEGCQQQFILDPGAFVAQP